MRTDQLYHIPPLAEQREIVRRVERLFVLAASIEARYVRELARWRYGQIGCFVQRDESPVKKNQAY
jgi:hypothetical protein